MVADNPNKTDDDTTGPILDLSNIGNNSRNGRICIDVNINNVANMLYPATFESFFFLDLDFFGGNNGGNSMGIAGFGVSSRSSVKSGDEALTVSQSSRS